MNERIKQLAEQAFFDESTSRPSTKMYTFSEHKMEKFAQLIVKECCDLMQGFTFEEIATKVIKKNFGVEE